MRTDFVAKLAVAVMLAGAMTAIPAHKASAQVLVNFDSVVAGTVGGQSIFGAAVDAYLADYGITFSDTTAGTLPGIQYAPSDGSAFIRAPSDPNHFYGHFATGSAYFYTLIFDSPLVSFGFDTSATGSTSTMAAWSATAYTASDTVLSSIGNPNISGTNTPVLSHLLTGPSIHHVTFMSDVKGFAGHQLAVDNLVLTIPEPETYALLLAGLGLLGFAARRRLK